jgi:hypothetical protein
MSVISIVGLAHVDIRGHDLDRSLPFYSLNATQPSEPKVPMDVLQKLAGCTHTALSCADVAVANVIELSPPAAASR